MLLLAASLFLAYTNYQARVQAEATTVKMGRIMLQLNQELLLARSQPVCPCTGE